MAVPRPSAAVLREDRLEYDPLPGSARLARTRAARLVREWGHPRAAQDVALVVSELATNALLHGCIRGRRFCTRLALTASAVRVEVSDACTERRPAPRTPADDEKFGRGLLIVEAVAARWGVVRRAAGKTVWAEVDLGPDGPTPAGAAQSTTSMV